MALVRKHLVAVLLGTLLVAGVSYVAAADLSAPGGGALGDDVFLAQDAQEGQDERPPGDEPGPRGRGGRGHKFGPGLHHALRGELVVPGEDEGTFRTVRIDRGVLERVDGSTLVIKEDDGTTVEVPTSDDTRIRRDREEATLGDLVAGDHVFTMRADEGDGLVTKGVRAISAERWEELEQRREECRANREECRAERMQRRAQRRSQQQEDAAA